MTKTVSAKEMHQLFKPFGDRHLSPSEQETLKRKSGDREEIKQTVDGLIAEGEVLLQRNDPASPAAQDWARRWAEIADRSKGLDPAFKDKIKAVWNDAMADPVVAAKMALNRKIFAFADQALKHWRSLPK